MDAVNALLVAAAVAFAAKTGAWLLQKATRNAGLVDSIWAFTLGGLAVLFAALGDAPPAVRIALALMGGTWGVRLGVYLWRRNHGKPEDWRYAQLRREWGSGADAKMFWFFQFQNVFTLMLAGFAFLPAAFRNDAPPAWCFGLAAVLWLTSVVGEAIADAQMARFRADPSRKGQVCRDGLWRYSRHPNYFFECVHWLAYVPLAAGAPLGWISLGAPLVMAFLLLRLSGVPLLEREMALRKPGYADYIKSTSALVPWPPRT